MYENRCDCLAYVKLHSHVQAGRACNRLHVGHERTRFYFEVEGYSWLKANIINHTGVEVLRISCCALVGARYESTPKVLSIGSGPDIQKVLPCKNKKRITRPKQNSGRNH